MLQRLAARRGKQNLIQVKAVGSSQGDGDVTAVRRVEGAPKEGNPLRLE
jgi:hypothetical protein